MRSRYRRLDMSMGGWQGDVDGVIGAVASLAMLWVITMRYTFAPTGSILTLACTQALREGFNVHAIPMVSLKKLVKLERRHRQSR